MNNTDDMTTFIPLNSVIEVSESSDVDSGNTTTSNEAINIKTCDGREFHFVFFSYLPPRQSINPAVGSTPQVKSKRNIGGGSESTRHTNALPDACESNHNDCFVALPDSSHTELDHEVWKKAPSTRRSIYENIQVDVHSLTLLLTNSLTHSLTQVDVHSLMVDGVHKAWYNLNRQVNMEKLECYNSDEGSPCHRMFTRVR